MSRLGWRLLFVVGFLPLGLIWMLWIIPVLIAAAIAWLLLGPDARDGQDRLERWMLGPVAEALEWPLDQLMRKAGVFREFWA